MKIKMTACVDDEGNDVFRLLLDEPIDVVVTDSKGTEQLKSMFSALLTAMLSEAVEIEFAKAEGYSNEMYESVCMEYIAVLNHELMQARSKLVAEKLCTS